jgi:hypothetical protein
MCGLGDVGRTKALGRYGSVGRHVPGESMIQTEPRAFHSADPGYDLHATQLANTRAAPPVPDDVTLSPVADDFLNKKCFAPSPRDRPVAEELLRHPFITDRDPNWTFMDSKIGRAVAAGTKRRRVEPSQG